MVSRVESQLAGGSGEGMNGVGLGLLPVVVLSSQLLLESTSVVVVHGLVVSWVDVCSAQVRHWVMYFGMQ